MLQTLVFFLALFATSAIAQSPDPLISSITSRQSVQSPSPKNCDATCSEYASLRSSCKSPGCGCNSRFLQAQGNCLGCKAGTPEGQAQVAYAVDAEVIHCNADGYPLKFILQLSPEAQAIVDKIDHEGVILRQAQRTFLALQIAGGHIGLTIVLAFSVFFRNVDSTFLNFCLTWIFSSVVYSILLYRGISNNTAFNTLGHVPPNKCLAQAALINGAQVMTTCSTMSLIVQLWLGLRRAIMGNVANRAAQARNKQLTTVMLIVLPYVFFFVFAIPSILVGKRHITLGKFSLEGALPGNFYCMILEANIFLDALYGATLVLLIITSLFDVHIIVVVYRYWRAFRHVETKNAIPLSILVRVITFSLYRVVVAIAYGTVFNKPPKFDSAGSGETFAVSFVVPIWVDMLQAAVPFVGFLIFGVNEELLARPKFCRRHKGPMSTGKPQT